MLPRNILMPAAFVTAIGVPLIAFQPDWNSAPRKYTEPTVDLVRLSANEFEALCGDNQLVYMPIASLGEVLRFDVYPNWVKSRWARVSTAPSSDGLQGMRVALVTGPNTWDICGALTYYFDENMRVQRISLIGDTGDASQLVKYLVAQFQFQVHPSKAAGLLTASKRRRMYGILKLENPTVINAADANHQVRVVMELNNPDGKLAVSQLMVGLVQSSRY